MRMLLLALAALAIAVPAALLVRDDSGYLYAAHGHWSLETSLSFFLLLLIGLLFTGCATVPTDYPRSESTAFQDYLDTTGGQLFEAGHELAVNRVLPPPHPAAGCAERSPVRRGQAITQRNQ